MKESVFVAFFGITGAGLMLDSTSRRRFRKSGLEGFAGSCPRGASAKALRGQGRFPVFEVENRKPDPTPIPEK